MTPTEMILHVLVGFPLALLFCNAVEWVVHRYALHGLGKRRGSFWAFHWHDHHRVSRKHDMRDDDYSLPLWAWNGHTKEILSLALGAAVWLPLLPFAPGFVAGIVYGAANYYVTHRRAHVDPAWAREHLPWHVDHHMGIDQDCNWCVTRPWLDHIMGTRVKYLGTERERGARRAAPTVLVAAEPKSLPSM